MGKNKRELKAEIQRLERINLELTEAAQLEKSHWNLLSEKRPVCDNPEQDGGFLSEAILIRNTSGLIYEVFARQYPDYVNLAFFTAESQDFKDGDSFICEVFIDDVVEWMEIPKN